MYSTSSSGKIFGVALSKFPRARLGEGGIPTIARELLTNLSSRERVMTEGLFRVSAANPEVNALVDRIESGEQLDWEEFSPHLVGTLLKKWLIDLPEPVLPFSTYEHFIAAMDSPAQLPKLQKVLKKLPSVNRTLTELILVFLSRVGACESVNQMTPQNLAVVFAPILLQPPTNKSHLLLIHANKGIQCIKFLIDHVQELYPQTFSVQRIMSSGILTPRTPPGSPKSADFSPPDSPSPSPPGSPMGSPTTSPRAEVVFSPFAPSQSSPTSAQTQNDIAAQQLALKQARELEEYDEASKVELLKATLDGAIAQLLDKLDDIGQEIQVSSSINDAVSISKKIRTAQTLLFDSAIFQIDNPSSSTTPLFRT